MKRLLFIFCVLFCVCDCFAQDYVSFILQRNGTFVNPEGGDYIVVEYEGKTASELYSMVKNNVMSFYKNPKEVMSENEPEMISIRGFHDKAWYSGAYFGAFYNLSFRFKDGKIRIDRPVIDSQLARTSEYYSFDTRTTFPFSYIAKKVCKNESEKNVKRKKKVEDVVNFPINYLLGKIKESSNQEEDPVSDDDDW